MNALLIALADFNVQFGPVREPLEQGSSLGPVLLTAVCKEATLLPKPTSGDDEFELDSTVSSDAGAPLIVANAAVTNNSKAAAENGRGCMLVVRQ